MSEAREFKPVKSESNIEFVSAKKLADDGFTGVVVQGTFEAALPNNFDDTKYDYKIKTDDGKDVIINSVGSLAYQMKEVPTGSYVRISYNGKKAIKSGNMKGKMAHDFLVEIA